MDLGPIERGPRRSSRAHSEVQAGVLWGGLDRGPRGSVSRQRQDRHAHRGRGPDAWRRHRVAPSQARADDRPAFSVDLITADGQFVRASATENPDLFWGVRGGGGNFGIVTEFEFRLDRVGPIVLAGPILWPMEESPKVLRFYRDWIAESPDELTTIVFQRKLPDLPTVPRDLGGRSTGRRCRCLLHRPCRRPVRRCLGPLKAFGSTLYSICATPNPSSCIRPCSTSRITTWLLVLRAILRCRRTERRGDRHLAVDHGNQINSPMSSLALWQMGGAGSLRVGENETAFNRRT